MNPENVLRGWLSEVAESSDVEVSLFADRGSEAWAAWLQFEGPSAAGQLTVWSTGDADLEVYRLDGETVLLRSEQGGDDNSAREWADEVLAHVSSIPERRLVRHANVDDVVAIAHLNQHVHILHAQAEPDDFFALDPSDAADFFESLLGDRANVLLLSEDADGQAIGYVWAQDQQRPGNPFTKPARTMYIHHVAVAPEVRGQGIGQSLVAAVETEARDRGISRIALDHWTFNETAHKFFASLGFQPYNVRMRRRLDTAEG